MAPPLVVPNSAQIKLYYVNNGFGAINTLGALVQGATVINQALANTLGAAIKSAFTTNLAASYATAMVFARVGIRDVRSPNLAEFRDTGATTAGTGVTENLPRNVAFCITLRTALAGRSFRGRIYLPGPLETLNDNNGNATTAFQTAALAFVNAISGAFSSNGLQLAVLSRPEEARTVSRTIKARAAQANSVIAVESRGVGWESQRRRNVGVGAFTALVSGQNQLISLV